ncbi:7906_t:CDS:2, partial [Racocetra fulgida]
ADNIAKIKDKIKNALDAHKQINKVENGIVSLDENIEKSSVRFDLEPIMDDINKLQGILKSIEKDIEGAKEYLDSLKQYINNINNYVKSEIEKKKSFEKLEQINMQIEKIDHNSEEDRWIKMLESKIKSRDDQIKLLLFEHLINIRYSITLFIDKCRHAYKYWSLSESNLELSILKEINEIEVNIMFKGLEDISNSKPQLKRTTLEFNEKNIIDEFKQKKSVEVVIKPDCNKLNKYARLRVHAFRVYLNGAGPIKDQVALLISHSDKFSDRDKKNQIYNFISDSSERGFEYRIYNDYSPEFDIDQKYIDLDNIYYDELDSHFTPTPFSQWTISLSPNDNGSYPDLSGLVSINVHLMVYCHCGAKKIQKDLTLKVKFPEYIISQKWVV